MKIDGSNDGPSSKFEKKEQIKLVLDMSNDGPMFKAIVNFFTLYSKQTYSFLITCWGRGMEGWRLLPQMLESMLSGTGSGGGAFGALQKLLKSGIPGLENLFGQNADGSLKWDDI